VAVSGFQVADLPESFHRGVERFISKPFNNEELLKTVEEVIEGSPASEALVSASR
jgi:FixJ family two-component response regulator